MTIALIIGAVLAVLGLGGLIWCIRQALWLKKTEMDEDTARRETGKLVTGHMASIGTAFLGMGVMLAGWLMG